jgi:hypothetical protein
MSLGMGSYRLASSKMGRPLKQPSATSGPVGDQQSSHGRCRNIPLTRAYQLCAALDTASPSGSSRKSSICSLARLKEGYYHHACTKALPRTYRTETSVPSLSVPIILVIIDISPARLIRSSKCFIQYNDQAMTLHVWTDELATNDRVRQTCEAQALIQPPYESLGSLVLPKPS